MDLLKDTWPIEFHSGIPVYRQIIHHVQAAVAAGRLGEGDQLPTIRALHEKLQVNPNTVAKAYRELQHLGVVAAEHGSGCYIAPGAAKRPPELPAREKKAKLAELCARFAAEARSHGISFDELVEQLKRLNPA
ncbi:MAG: GntR family transcriptional regulator [Verrucomicrobia bacterium]|nr:GntR family transcriptional regulator [Verrucomicrobiota bacterium]